MKAEVVTSRSNALAKLARTVRDGKTHELILVEGVRLCEEAARAEIEIAHVLFTEKVRRDVRGALLLQKMKERAEHLTAVSEDVLASVADTRTPQGIIALARRPPTDCSVLERDKSEKPLVVVMHGANNPANAGAMMRVAEAAGANGMITTHGSTDLYAPKALRGAMGSSFRLRVWGGASFAEAVGWCRARGIQTVCTDARAAQSHTEIDWTLPRAVIVGGEGGGLTDDELKAADACVRIPMRAPVESLNVAVALAVVLYEAARQRANL
ncbi:MAG TPA: RNA methyltransferase [Pyrinomonadaceae bacterium]